MTPTQVTLIIIQLGLILAALSFLIAWLGRARQEKYKYRLYAVRDELIYLVATNQLKEESRIFTVLYMTINATLAEVRDVDRWAFIRASTRARTELEEANVEELVVELSRASTPIRRVAYEFIDTMFCIMKANSPFTKLCIWLVKSVKDTHLELVRKIEKLLPKEQYDNYQYFRHLSTEMHAH